MLESEGSLIESHGNFMKVPRESHGGPIKFPHLLGQFFKSKSIAVILGLITFQHLYRPTRFKECIPPKHGST